MYIFQYLRHVLKLLPFQGATVPTRDTQGAASLALGWVLHWAFSPHLLNPKVELCLREKHGDDTWNFSVKFSAGQAGVSPYVFTDIAFLPKRDEAAEKPTRNEAAEKCGTRRPH